MTSALVIGDLGFTSMYHLGDEAMSEAAAEVLTGVGIDVTLIAGQPAAATERYDLPAVARPGFRKVMSRQQKDALLEEITDALASSRPLPGPAAKVFQAVEAADVMVIGGGGNLNSQGTHHLYDRVALARMAGATGTPLVVSSQTVGPALTDRDRELVTELGRSAVAFGVREATTYQLMQELVGADGQVVLTMDDAALLSPAPSVEAAGPAVLARKGRYIIASFTSHTGTSGMNQETYVSELTRLLDELVAEHDLDVYLVAHMGSFVEPARNDQLLNTAIEAASTSGRVHALPMIDARTTLALTQGAEFTLSTRYHPVVFGPALGVPSFGLVLSHYSSVRMRGALGNVGLTDLALPLDYWLSGGLQRSVRAVIENRASFDEHVAHASSVRRAEQLAWWAAVEGLARTGRWTPPAARAELPEWAVPGVSGWEFDTLTSTSDTLALQRREVADLARQLSETLEQNSRLEEQNAKFKGRIERLTGKLDRSRTQLDRVRHEKVAAVKQIRVLRDERDQALRMALPHALKRDIRRAPRAVARRLRRLVPSR
ncbi:hypothetical protein GCM10009718_30770 [Isoptericola halotolerans]|uniref:Polysaccharide pyruvyl transferase WcaK-like protein/regulator of replication initiation timing n=1 Tax=Isoptericola halotolerans TaxID=300560 RepID=A0ABX2A4K0_9MICO|nr:polysaccharide pyruvyl transferase family protein [Isoptericola halotolerans]NOV97584.1 polysaccharide pyruvyl transferase WcaK-like protein/regulator of replication initiation timing [Isoptericola halotolerans]